MTSFTVGIAQENRFLALEDSSSKYLGEGWTSATLEQESNVTVHNQLTMTAGLNDLFFDCVTANCLKFKADASTRWAYHNGPYTLLQSLVSSATNMEWGTYFNSELRNKIGMNGAWILTNGSNNVYFSNARSMARFGLLNLNSGNWENKSILADYVIFSIKS